MPAGKKGARSGRASRAESRTANRSAKRGAERARKESYHHGDLRRALLDATLRLVDERGPQGFTLRAAAKAAGVTPGATYHHFDDKDSLLAALAEEGFEMFRVALEAAAQRPAESALERSRNVGAAYVLFAIEHRTRFRVMLGYGVRTRLGRGKLETNAVAAYEFVREALIQGLKDAGRERISDAEVLGWWSVVHGLAFLAIDGHLGKVGTSSKHAAVIVRDVLKAFDEHE